MSWLLYVCLDLIFTVLCYLTNWFVVIFADEKGQLPKVFKLWQTYDNPRNLTFGRCLDLKNNPVITGGIYLLLKMF
jgi:hypothetical protein